MDKPWIKLFALMVLGGVAKALFDDRPIVHNHYEAPEKSDVDIKIGDDA